MAARKCESDDAEEKGRRELFGEVARILGRTAGRTGTALLRLGERGAVRLAARKLRREREKCLRDLGAVAHEALSSGGRELQASDDRVADIMRRLDAIERRLGRLQACLSKDGPSPRQPASGEGGAGAPGGAAGGRSEPGSNDPDNNSGK